MDNDAKSDHTEQIYFRNGFVRTIGRRPLQQTKVRCPRLGETANTMDQIHYIPQAGNKKKKGDDHPGREAEDTLKRTRSREPAGCPRDLLPPLSPGARSTRRPATVGSSGGHSAGRLRSRCEVRRSEGATFCLQHQAPSWASTEEYQGSHKGDMVAYHAPWKREPVVGLT